MVAFLPCYVNIFVLFVCSTSKIRRCGPENQNFLDTFQQQVTWNYPCRSYINIASALMKHGTLVYCHDMKGVSRATNHDRYTFVTFCLLYFFKMALCDAKKWVLLALLILKNCTAFWSNLRKLLAINSVLDTARYPKWNNKQKKIKMRTPATGCTGITWKFIKSITGRLIKHFNFLEKSLGTP